MKKVVSVVHLGMEGEGKNISEARRDAEKRIEACLTGDWMPYFITHLGQVAVIARHPRAQGPQWGYRVINPATPNIELMQGLDLNYTDRPAAVRAAAFDLAQRTGTYLGLKPYMFPSQIAELDQYFHWQAAYKTAKELDYSDQDCRRIADRAISTTVPEAC